MRVEQRWRQIESLFHAAHEKNAEEWAQFLDEACRDDPPLRREVESLLACEERAAGFLESAGGAGGMGQVYKALDRRLSREVAIKFLPPAVEDDGGAPLRFESEARAASALNHPNICTVYDVGESQGRPFIVLELLEGAPLRDRISGTPLPLDDFFSVARQVCAGLAAAHSKGIVHRDVKPANMFVGGDGQVKLLDFGLAKRGGEAAGAYPASQARAPGARALTLTETGTFVGTLAYMSPEQILGEEVDARSDVFSLGIVLYEMATGRPPFRGKTAAGVLGSILTETPARPSEVNAAIPDGVGQVILQALQKEPGDRYQSVESSSADLDDCRRALVARTRRRLLRNPRFAIPVLLVLLAVLACGIRWNGQSRSANWARGNALPEIARLVAKEDFDGAFRLGREAERYIPRDPELLRLQYHYQIRHSVNTDPPGADVYVKGYLSAGASWIYLGKSPIDRAPIPRGHNRWKIEKEGFGPVEGAFSSYTGLPLPTFKLRPKESSPPGMIRVPGGSAQIHVLPVVQLEYYWLDRYEVSNRQFKNFVDQGGYRQRQYWEHPFVKDGKVLTWEQAMAEFRDATGWPGPAFWEDGSYPAGQDDFPVGGVSWYEAAAYARFVGRSLPAYHQWRRAAGNLWFSDILRLSNFSGKGPAVAGSLQGLSPYGNYDMAGNVREWCWNQAGAEPWGKRYILGGSWAEAPYMFKEDAAAPPFDRSRTNGFRCAWNSVRLSGELLGSLAKPARDYSREKPVDDAIFRVYRSFYSYDRTALKAVVESVDDTPRYWRRETVTFDAAYGGERVIAHLFLPKGGAPPYQTVIYFPGSGSLVARSSEELEVMVIDFLLRGGRAVLYPVYRGMYERRQDPSLGGRAFNRDRMLSWSKDFGRSVDYLETRPDIDHQKLAFFGFSLGGIFGPILTAIDGRMKASILLGGGFLEGNAPPEADPLHFAPRATEPALMIAGRYDFARPLENCQLPMLRLLGAPEKDKRIALVDSGHVVFPTEPVMEEIVRWLNRYLGPVPIVPIN